jgi:hypothetical protein
MDRTFRALYFEWSHVENGVRMQKLWPVKVCCQKLTKTDQTIQCGLILDWTSRERGQPDLDADLFFGIFFPDFFD